MTKIGGGCLLFILVFAVVCTLPAQAPTQADIEAAIIDGVEWLANQQEIDGSWPGYIYAGINFLDLGTTGLAVLKLEERAYELGYDSPFNLNYAYHNNVILGLDYLFSKLVTIGITLQNHQAGATGTIDDPDYNGNGWGIYANGTTAKATYVYDTGITLAAISASRTPDRLAPNSETYLEIAQDIVDWLAWAQSDKDYPSYGMGEGGWAYYAVDNSYSAHVDNSISGYATMGLAYAIRFGCVLPTWVKTELSAFIDDIQDPVNGDLNDGGSWYEYPGGPIGVNILKTGNLIFEMKLVEDISTTPRVVNALNYLKAHWSNASGSPQPPGWDGNPAEYQTMFCAMKGLSYMGIDTFDGIDWYADFSDRIVAQQCKIPGANYGSWQTSSGLGNPILITEWALLTLEKMFAPAVIHLDAEPPILIDLANPVGTAWHELYPDYCNWHYLAGWLDSNNNSILDRCDHIILDNETGYSGWYNVEDVTVTLRLANSTLNETMYVEFSGSFQDFPFNDPVNTTWHEVYPEYGNWFNLTFWSDTDLTGNLTSSDQITLENENATEWHVDAVKTDLLVTFEKYPDFGDAPDFYNDPSYMYPSKLFGWLGDGGPPDTVSYWSFYEGEGLTASDFVDGNDGALTIGTTWIDGFFGSALDFDEYYDCVIVPNDDSLNVGAGDFSVQAWIKPSAVSGTKTIVDKRLTQSVGYAVFIWNGRFGLQLADGGYANYFVPADMSVAVDGEWHFVFVSVDRSSCATFYVDDKQISIPIGHPGNLDNSADLRIGGNSLSSSLYFEGGIDEVALYKRALTSREVRQLRQLQVRDGASHVDWNYEWLGESVNGEIDSKQTYGDEFDDGVKAQFYVVYPPIDHSVVLRLWITITTSGQLGRYNISDPNKVMYLNAWIDWNQDYDWADDGEKIIGTNSPTGTQNFTGPGTAYYSMLTPVSAWLGRNWLRVRLDYGEDVGENPQSWTDVSLDQYKGQAMFGEVEDYQLSRDVGVSGVVPSKSVIGEGYSGKINVTVVNQGGCTETFNVTAYANTTAIQTITNITLLSKDSAILTFTWNTSGFARGNYTISVYATPVLNETDIDDNTLTDGWTIITIRGDVNGDFKVDGKDVAAIAKAYNTKTGDLLWNPNADINGDDKVDGKDIAIVAKYYGTHYP
jgi:hypothetical protein